MQNSESITASQRPVPMVLLLLAAVVVHLPLLLMKLPLKSYDANFHIFFASHYVQQWFDPWNSKWYAGFSQTTYPPLPQQWVALISPIFGLEGCGLLIPMASHNFLVASNEVSFSASQTSTRPPAPPETKPFPSGANATESTGPS